MPTITIDGQTIEAPAGAMLLPVALENSIHIPHYVGTPSYRSTAVVGCARWRSKAGPKLVIACNMPIREGMVVHTHQLAGGGRNTRRGVMEPLARQPPRSTVPFAIKPANACCRTTRTHTEGRSRVPKSPRRKLEKRKDIGPRMILDQERCILCRRCVRFCREVTGTNELGVFNIGDHSVLDCCRTSRCATTTPSARPTFARLAHWESKDFHHKLRVWFLKKTSSVCPSCSNGCNITVHHYRNRIWRLVPQRNDAVNQTWMCDHGRLNYEYVNAPDRLRQPLWRRNGELAPCELGRGTG